jgi:hypothetical protein
MRPIPTSNAVALVLTLAAAAPAVAQQQKPDAQVAAGPVAPPAPPASLDPNIDRAFLQPTAMTQPGGSVTYNNYELLLHGVTYGITDRVQATLTALSPVTKDMPLLFAAALKGRISPTDRVHLALQGSVWLLHAASGSGGADLYSFGAGSYGTICLSADCASMLNASVNYQYADSSDSAGGAHLLIYGGALILGASDSIKLLAEATSAAGGSANSSLDNVPGFLFSYGVRFHTSRVAADVGFMKPVDTGSGSSDNFLLGLPFVSVSYRSS